MKPLLKWAGGKARLAPAIEAAFGAPCIGTYHEPFCGSGAVFLYRRALGTIGADVVLSDANPKLMAVHEMLRDAVDDVLHELTLLPEEDWKERYYEIRDSFNGGPWRDPAHAARFIWLNRASFNGLYRENRDGNFNVPVGRYEKVMLPSPARFYEVHRALQGVRLRTCTYAEALADVGRDDHVYCDPPYVPLSATAKFTGYTQGGFGLDDQAGLAACARVAADRGARVVLSNHDLPLVREHLYPLSDGFHHVGQPRVSRAISRSAEARKAGAAELVARIGPRAA
jgi:DNA adenine methylase